MKAATTLIVAFLTTICPLFVSSADITPGDRDYIEFVVASCYDSMPIAKVSVLLISMDHRVATLGETDELGRIAIDRDKISGIALMFCKDGYFCGALRVEADHVRDLDERLIHLAPFAL